MSAYDPRSILVEALRRDTENFQLSNLILGKKGPKAIFMLYGLRDDLFKFAHDPNAAPLLPPMPRAPDITEDMTEEEKKKRLADFEELTAYWLSLKEAHALNVPLKDYMHIVDYLNKYFKTLHSTPAIKGLRFYSFTKNTERAEQNKGFLSRLINRGGNNQQAE